MVSRAADLILDHPRATLIAWLAVIVALMPQAALVNGRLTEPSYIVHGTESQRALAIDERTFGPNVELPILVTGPPAAVARTAPRIATALGRLQGINILSPYDSDVTALRPRPGEAMLIAQISTQPSQVLAQAGRVARSTAALVRPPLHASITGEAFIGKSLQDETLAGTHRAEGIAIPVLLIVLLLVFGTPVAAMIPALFGVATVAAGFGVISLLALVMPLEATALSLASMMGLAIGVDYSLLLVARFREELGAATAPEAVRAAARTAVRTAGRTTAFAGATLAIALIVALAVSPGTLILSSIIGVIVVACLSVISAVLVVPAALVLIGPRINRFTIWRRRRGTGARITRGIASLVLRRPAVAAVAIVVPLAVLGAHAFALTPRTPGVDLLPPGDAARVQYAAVSGAMGPGWGATFRVNVSVSRGTLTDARHLGELVDLQHRLTRVPGVAAVIGPAALTSASDAVQGISAQLTSFERSATTTRPQLEHLRHVIATAGSAVTELKGSLTRAANAGGQLAGGAGQARAAAQQLSDGIGQLQGATAQLVSGLDAAASGATQLADGSARASGGASQLLTAGGTSAAALSRSAPLLTRLAKALSGGAKSIGQLEFPAQAAQAQVAAALADLKGMTSGRKDPRYQSALLAVEEADAVLTGVNPVTGAHVQPGYPGLATALAQVATGAKQAQSNAASLAAGASQLQSGVARLRAGEQQLADGLRQLRTGSAREAASLADLVQRTAASEPGIARLDSGEQQLTGGLARLADSAGQLQAALGSAPGRLAPLTSGLAQSAGALTGATKLLDETAGLRTLTARSPGLFASGDLLLAALDGAPAPTRRAAQSLVSVERGGQGARLFVVPSSGPTAAATARVYDRLRRIVAAFAARTGTTAAVGGDAALVIDYARQISAILPLLIATLAVITWVALVIVTRAIVLPLIAVALNLLTVGAAFGALVLLYQGAAPALGGPGYLDAVAVVGIFGIVFGLSIDYEVFLVSRMREEYARTGSTELAIERGLLQTAGVVTGAAAIMAGVFAAFALSSFVDIAEFGTGLTIAVVLDATLVRIVLLPALTRLCGAAAWWLPRWLDRIVSPWHAGELEALGSGAEGAASAQATATATA